MWVLAEGPSGLSLVFMVHTVFGPSPGFQFINSQSGSFSEAAGAKSEDGNRFLLFYLSGPIEEWEGG